MKGIHTKLDGFDLVTAIGNKPVGDFVTGDRLFQIAKRIIPFGNPVLGVFEFDFLNGFLSLVVALRRHRVRRCHRQQTDCKTCEYVTKRSHA